MLSSRLYYSVKPYLPWRLRIGVRRLSARRKRARFSDQWPIDAGAGRAPEGWPGWPEGKRFAFVLTHDVESEVGLQNCRPVAELEQQLGFRSCFNLIPEGRYAVPAELRAWLTSIGCEVGVHDLKHDGRLFSSHRGFSEKAARINDYLAAWNADGFRSGFMLRNLDWLHELRIKYDSSTFDTDPFEPQSEGAGTIFPFWQQQARDDSGGNAPAPGYVEIPYTLPQDSTLFIILQESSPEIWLRKLDWIAEHGGMAVVNVHPDYLRLNGAPAHRTYPVSHYRQLLDYVASRYRGQYWQALPGEIARYVACLPQRPVVRPRKRVCMVTHSFYESDNRVTRYAEALAARGDDVDVLALRSSPQQPPFEVMEGVSVFRIQNRFGKKEQSRLDYLFPVLRFLGVSSWWLTRRHARQRYDLLHIHNMPDFLVFAGWYPRLRGTPVILDIHDIVPEFYASKFRRSARTLTVALLRWIERRAARFASHVIISNHLWLDKYVGRTGAGDKCSVFINNVDTRVFHPRPRTRHDGKLVVLFPGGLQWHQGLDIALRAFQRVHAELPQTEFHIYGDGNMKPALVALAGNLGFNGCVKFFAPVRVKEIAQIMAEADVGIVPKRADSFGNEAYSTKIMEFMSLGVPVVVSKTKIDQYYFNDSVVRFFESGNPEALAEAIIELLKTCSVRDHLISAGLSYSRQHSWSVRQADYLTLVDQLMGEVAPPADETNRAAPPHEDALSA